MSMKASLSLGAFAIVALLVAGTGLFAKTRNPLALSQNKFLRMNRDPFQNEPEPYCQAAKIKEFAATDRASRPRA